VFAVALTDRAADIGQADVDALREQGLDDAAISDTIQVIAYFNYVTRVADGVGIDDEPEWSNRGQTPRV
jgi:alkylhydroperoxidase family enzyme